MTTPTVAARVNTNARSNRTRFLVCRFIESNSACRACLLVRARSCRHRHKTRYPAYLMSLTECPTAVMPFRSVPWIATVSGLAVLLLDLMLSAVAFTRLRHLIYSDGAARMFSVISLLVAVSNLDAGRISRALFPHTELSAKDRQVLAVLMLIPSMLFSAMQVIFPRSVLTLSAVRVVSVIASVFFLLACLVLSITVSDNGYGGGAPLLSLAELSIALIPRTGYIGVPTCSREDVPDHEKVLIHRCLLQLLGIIARCGVFVCVLITAATC